MCMFGVGCVGKASDRMLSDLSQWELVWWRLPGREWQVLPAVTAAVWKRWQGLCEERWAVASFFPRHLFVWASIFCMSFSPLLLVGVIYLPMWLTLYSEEDKTQNGPFCQYFQCYVLLALIQIYILNTWMCVCVCMCACMWEVEQTWYAIGEKKVFYICSETCIPTKEK